MQALTTVYTPPASCSSRYAVFLAGPSSSSTIPPSSGWIDPLFTGCIPTEYQDPYPTFSPGVCPKQMGIVAHTSNEYNQRTIWTGRCCERCDLTFAVFNWLIGDMTINWTWQRFHNTSSWSRMALHLDRHDAYGFPPWPEHHVSRHLHDAIPFVDWARSNHGTVGGNWPLHPPKGSFYVLCVYHETGFYCHFVGEVRTTWFSENDGTKHSVYPNIYECLASSACRRIYLVDKLYYGK